MGSTKAAMLGTVVGGKENDEERRLCLFKRSVSVYIFYFTLGWRPLSGGEDMLRGASYNLHIFMVG